jgi:hypothetical protein
MFPSLAPRRIADTLLEVADAMLRPLPDDDAAHAAAVDGRASRCERDGATAAHPHRQPVRIPRERRGGTPVPPTHHCITALPPRKPATRRMPSRA